LSSNIFLIRPTACNLLFVTLTPDLSNRSFRPSFVKGFFKLPSISSKFLTTVPKASCGAIAPVISKPILVAKPPGSNSSAVKAPKVAPVTLKPSKTLILFGLSLNSFPVLFNKVSTPDISFVVIGGLLLCNPICC